MTKKNKKSKAIVVDMDDTISGFSRALCAYTSHKYKVNIVEEDITNWNFTNVSIKHKGGELTGDHLNSVFKEFEYEFYCSMEPFRYSLKALNAIRADGYKIIILTARDEKFKKATEFNLTLHDVSYDELIFDWDKVKRINELKKVYNVTAFVDDKAETVKAIADSCKLKNVFLIERGRDEDEELEEEGIIKIRDLLQVVRYI